MQESGTTAGLRGIDSVDGTVAWASGTGGTVLKTTDGGAHWQKCAVPDAARDGAMLDFRGVQAWDANTAIVMASGPGEKSRLYKTTDGCKTWKLTFKNPDKDGFWDAVRFFDQNAGVILGDPVNGKIFVRITSDGGKNWQPLDDDDVLRVVTMRAGIYAASNSSLMLRPRKNRIIEFVANVEGTASLYFTSFGLICGSKDTGKTACADGWIWDLPDSLPIPSNGESSGAFSLAWDANPSGAIRVEIVVGGDYKKPGETQGTAAYTTDSGESWSASKTPPHGFRSSVQWSEALKAWITAGTNGSDESRDDGKTWQPLDDGNWNALSLPFVVGSNGRIARLNASGFPAGK
jgi:photosystem II stability/assembly factor-like uncharacterized protein